MIFQVDQILKMDQMLKTDQILVVAHPSTQLPTSQIHPTQILPASSGIFSSSSLAAYASTSFANYMLSDRATYAERFGCIEEEEESEDELIIVDDGVTGTSRDFNQIVNEVVQYQPEIQS